MVFWMVYSLWNQELFIVLPDFLTCDADGFIHLSGHRIGLQDVARLYREGQSPEMIAIMFPTLTLAQIHKTIGHYLENQTEVDALIVDNVTEIAKAEAANPPGPSMSELRRRLEVIREQRQSQREPRLRGNCKGMITLLVEDDEHLRGFEEHMR